MALTVLFLIVAVLVIGTGVRLWPFISGVVDGINNLVTLDENITDIKTASAEKKTMLEKLSVDVADNTKTTRSVRDDLDAHIRQTAAATERWAAREDGIDEILKNQKTVLHEMQHNGGSSMKDDSKATRAELKAIRERLEAMDASLVTGQLPIPKRPRRASATE